jgi:hypothetical protein
MDPIDRTCLLESFWSAASVLAHHGLIYERTVQNLRQVMVGGDEGQIFQNNDLVILLEEALGPECWKVNLEKKLLGPKIGQEWEECGRMALLFWEKSKLYFNRPLLIWNQGKPLDWVWASDFFLEQALFYQKLFLALDELKKETQVMETHLDSFALNQDLSKALGFCSFQKKHMVLGSWNHVAALYQVYRTQIQDHWRGLWQALPADHQISSSRDLAQISWEFLFSEKKHPTPKRQLSELTLHLIQQGHSLSECQKMETLIHSYCTEHRIDPGDLLPEELSVIHPALNSSCGVFLKPRPPQKDRTTLALVLDQLESFFKTYHLIVCLFVVMTFVSCGFKTQPLSEVPEKRPPFPFDQKETQP